MFRRAIPQALLSIPIMAFMAFYIWGTSTPLRMALALGRTPSFLDAAFPALGLMFVVVVIGLALSPWLERAKASRTFYALTDRRALVVVEGNSRTIKSVSPAEFALERRDLPNGQGDVTLKREIRGSGRNRMSVAIGFYSIDNAREVERVARELAQGAR